VFIYNIVPVILGIQGANVVLCGRWNVVMPAIVARSISILSDAGLGMAMFSLGMYSKKY